MSEQNKKGMDMNERKNPENYFSTKFMKQFNKLRADKQRFYAAMILLTLISLYLASLVARLMSGGFSTSDIYGNVTHHSLSPLETIPYMIESGQITIFLAVMAIWGLLYLFIKTSVPTFNYDERGFVIADQGTYGTAGWMKKEEAKEQLLVIDKEVVEGPIFGKMIDIDNTEKVVSFRLKGEYEGDMRQYQFNKNTAVYGAPGSRKSRSWVRPQIMQCIRRGESVIITDPKSEMYQSMAGLLEDNGYDVKVFNLITPSNGDTWNPLKEISEVPEDQIELMAQTFANVVIANTIGEGGKADHFWDNAEMNLLKALTLYVLKDESRDEEYKNFGEVYRLLTQTDPTKLDLMFDALPSSHPAKQPYTIYSKAGPSVKGNIIIGLGSRLQVFQAKSIANLTASNSIDLTSAGLKKTAIFLIMSDQDATLSFLSSLFFSFLFIKLVRYADTKSKTQVLPVPVNLVLDEFPNIGRIPDFEKKISTVRSRGINISIIFQNLAQLQNRYPQGTWEEILGNCDSQLFLGCNDQLTAEYISKRTGLITVEVSSTNVQKKTMAPVQSIPSYRESHSQGKRMLMEPDEILRLHSDTCLLIAKGSKVLKLQKFDFTEHPLAKGMREKSIDEYHIELRAKKKVQESKKKAEDSVSDEADEVVIEDNEEPKTKWTKKVDYDIPNSEFIIDSEGERVRTPSVDFLDEKLSHLTKNRHKRQTARKQTYTPNADSNLE